MSVSEEFIKCYFKANVESMNIVWVKNSAFVVRSNIRVFQAVEAHACGCPIVAFDIPGLKDIVKTEVTGFLTSAFDPGTFGTTIFDILLSSELEVHKMKIEYRIRAKKLWSNDAVVPMYLKPYGHAIKLDRNFLHVCLCLGNFIN